MAIHFCKDTPDAVYIGIVYHDPITFQTLIKLFEEYKTKNYVKLFIEDGNEEEWHKTRKPYTWIYSKGYTYNFEDIIKFRGITEFPVFILQNGKWFQWSPDPGIFLPCE